MRLRICPLCKCPGLRDQTLCLVCARALWPRVRPIERQLDRLSVWSLFPWNPGEAQILPSLIYALKGRDGARHWLDFARWTALLSEPLPEDAVLMPIPGPPPNHALGWARALGRLFQRPVADMLLNFGPHLSQKTRRRQHRRDRQFHLRRQPSCREYRTVILVDDVITTGSTLTAAAEAIASEKPLKALCLMDRRPCDATRPLL